MTETGVDNRVERSFYPAAEARSGGYDETFARFFGVDSRASMCCHLYPSKDDLRELVLLVKQGNEEKLRGDQTKTGVLDLEAEQILCERSLEVLDGKRKSPDSLVTFARVMAERAKICARADSERYNLRPVRRRLEDVQERRDRIGTVVAWITDNAGRWGRGDDEGTQDNFVYQPSYRALEVDGLSLSERLRVGIDEAQRGAREAWRGVNLGGWWRGQSPDSKQFVLSFFGFAAITTTLLVVVASGEGKDELTGLITRGFGAVSLSLPAYALSRLTKLTIAANKKKTA